MRLLCNTLRNIGIVKRIHSAVAQAHANHLPIIDIGGLRHAKSDAEFQFALRDAGARIDNACRTAGFFYITNHGVSIDLQSNLEKIAHSFFALPIEEKKRIDMVKHGKAWRGYFSLGHEATSGIPDQKEGLYYGPEIANNTDTRPLRGSNLWLDGEFGDDMKSNILAYMRQMKEVGNLLVKIIAYGLQLNKAQFGNQFENPSEMFSIVNYPPHDPSFSEKSVACGEHTDYGYLTLLKQDSCGGLQVQSNSTNEWVDAPYIPNSFVINLGDALERSTHGLYKATLHRVVQRKNTTVNRISMPYYFDPNFDSRQQSLVPFMCAEDQAIVRMIEERKRANLDLYLQDRWDKEDIAMFGGTYADYLVKKAVSVFPNVNNSLIDKS